MFKRILQEIKNHETVIIHRHCNPDGDAIGSQIGLKKLLQENFPEKRIYAVGDDPKRYAFVEDSTPDEVSDESYENALAIVLDCGASALISDERYKTAKTSVRFDHHIFSEKIANYEVVDTSYESCCGLITDFALQSGLRLSPSSAKALFTGMVTDSGRFRYDSTNSNTFRLASALLKEKFNPSEIYTQLYADELSNVQLRAKFALKIQRTAAGVAYIYTTKEELATALEEIQNEEKYGMVLRAKGIVASEGEWLHFDYVPEEPEIRVGSAGVIGRLCVIGCKLNEKALEELFKA